MQGLRGEVEETSKHVEQEWSGLTEAVASMLDKLREEHEQLGAEVEEALQATAGASGAVHESGSQARSEIAQGQADLDALSQHASGLQPGFESQVAEVGEAPAQGLAQRAQEVEQELSRVMDEAREFLQDEVAAAMDELAADVRERCQALRATIAEERAETLQAAFDDWEAKVDELEAHVTEEGFIASHSHARTVVEWALETCKAACVAHLEAVHARMEESVGPLQELAGEVQQAGAALAGSGAGLIAELQGARESIAGAVSALDAVKETLASYSFVGM